MMNDPTVGSATQKELHAEYPDRERKTCGGTSIGFLHRVFSPDWIARILSEGAVLYQKTVSLVPPPPRFVMLSNAPPAFPAGMRRSRFSSRRRRTEGHGEEKRGDEVLRPPWVEVGAGSGSFPVHRGDSLVLSGVCCIFVCCDGDSRSSSGPASSRIQPPELCLRGPRVPDGLVHGAGCSSRGRRDADRKIEGDVLRRFEPPRGHLGGLVDYLRLCTPTQPCVL